MLINPWKVLINSYPDVSENIDSLMTITNFTFLTLSKTYFKKYETPITPI